MSFELILWVFKEIYNQSEIARSCAVLFLEFWEISVFKIAIILLLRTIF